MLRPAAPRRRRLAGSIGVLLLGLAALAPAAGGAHGAAVRDFAIPVTDSHPTGIAVGADGAVWFSEYATSAIGRRAKDGSFQSFALPPHSYPNGMVLGPDGAVWFTDYENDRIGRIDTSGRITLFPVAPCGGCGALGPWDIALGADGALWFTEQEAGAIGRITTSGSVTQFPLPQGSRDPFAITAGPDGALWFSDESGIGRITTTGAFTQAWTGSGSANGIATGPDGNVWFTLGASDAVARLDVATGHVSLHALGSNCDPQEIASGAGALWFGCYFSDHVYRITPAGALTDFAVPNHFGGSYPDTVEGIVAGKRAIWFSEEAAARIGRISTR